MLHSVQVAIDSLAWFLELVLQEWFQKVSHQNSSSRDCQLLNLIHIMQHFNPWNFTSRSPANNEYLHWSPIRALVPVRNRAVCSLRIDRYDSQQCTPCFWDRLSFIEIPSHSRSVKSHSSSTFCGPIIPPMESIVRRHNPGKSWPCILVTAFRPARYNRLGILQPLWCSKKPFTMQAAFSKLTLENTSQLAVLFSLALGRVFSQSANFCSLDLLSMLIAWEAISFPLSSTLSMPTIRAIIFIGRWTWCWATTW